MVAFINTNQTTKSGARLTRQIIEIVLSKAEANSIAFEQLTIDELSVCEQTFLSLFIYSELNLYFKGF